MNSINLDTGKPVPLSRTVLRLHSLSCSLMFTPSTLPMLFLFSLGKPQRSMRGFWALFITFVLDSEEQIVD